MKKNEHKMDIPVIYELPVRNFSEDGNIVSVTKRLEEIKHLGIDVIWLMPIYESAQINKKRGRRKSLCNKRS